MLSNVAERSHRAPNFIPAGRSEQAGQDIQNKLSERQGRGWDGLDLALSTWGPGAQLSAMNNE